MRPPSSAPSSAAHSPMPTGALGAAARAALASSACCNASGTAVGSAATGGQLPCTATVWRTPACSLPPSASATTSGNSVGLWLRWGVSGMRAVQRSPSQACVQAAPGSISAGVSGKNSSVWPRQAAGSLSSCTAKKPASGVTDPLPAGADTGRRAKAASNSVAWLAVLPCTGRFRVKRPSSGIHSCRQASQVASSVMGSVAPLGACAMVSGTGSSTVPS